MKKLYFIILLIASFKAQAQKLTLTDLINLSNKKNWEEVNQVLLSKNWIYFKSERGDSYKYSTIIWSFNKSYTRKKPQN